MNEHLCIAPDVTLGEGVKLSRFINLYGCDVGDNTKIGAFVEVQKKRRDLRRACLRDRSGKSGARASVRHERSAAR